MKRVSSRIRLLVLLVRPKVTQEKARKNDNRKLLVYKIAQGRTTPGNPTADGGSASQFGRR